MANESLDLLLDKWERRVKKNIEAHYASEQYYNKRHKALGMISIALGSIITALSFYYLSKSSPEYIQLIIGFSAISQIIISSLHTWLRYDELANKHHNTGSKYASIRRLIEQFKLERNESNLNEIREHIDKISDDSPIPPTSIWKGIQKKYKERERTLE